MTLGDFSAQAEAYERARPGYPEELVEELLFLAELGERAQVLDLGAGTGILSRQLAARGLRVTALEPNPRMRERAAPHELVTWREGTFEVTGLSPDAFDLATAGQCLHWADLPRALPEIRRVLRTDARLVVLWNDREHERHPVLQHTLELVRARVPGFDEGYRNRDWAPLLTSTGDFTDPIARELRHVVPMTRDRYLDLWRSHNMLNHLVGPEGVAEILREVEARLDREGWRVIRVPYLCRAWIARRV